MSSQGSFGKLTVLEIRAGSKEHHRVASCRCVCGGMRLVRLTRLKKGSVVECAKCSPERALDPGNCRLEDTAQLVSVTSPSACDWKDTSGMSEGGVDPDGSTRSRLDQLPRQAQLADSGPTATGGTGATASSGQLDPAYSRWLMGLPAEWCDCAVTAMASLQKQRKSSLKATQQSGERPKGEA